VLKPVIVKSAVSPLGVAVASLTATEPVVHVTWMVTSPVVPPVTVLATWSCAEFWVFVIVHEPVPPLIVPPQVPAGEPLAL
jgi:hypothetical protein